MNADFRLEGVDNNCTEVPGGAQGRVHGYWNGAHLSGTEKATIIPLHKRGSGQVVRHQPSKLIFAGSNPVSRSRSNSQFPGWLAGKGARGAVVSAGDS